MRVGISTLMIQRGQTGIAQYLFALLRAFLAHRTSHEFVLFVLRDDLDLFSAFRGAMRLVPVNEWCRPPVRNIAWHQTELPRLARRLGLHVLHIPSYRRLVWARPCPTVATIHDLAPFRLPGKYDWKRMLYGRVIARRLAGRQDHIIAVSECTARDITRFFGIARERITVVPLGLEHGRFFPGSREQALAEARRQHGVSRPFFLYVARLEHPAKNHVRLIEAFNRFKETTGLGWELVLAGGDWHGADAIHAAIRRSPFASDIRRLGFVPDAALPNLYRAADVFVYPSLFEGFGMPVTEAMACGCPVIASTRGSLGEVLGDAAAVVDPEDPGSIAGELSRLAGDAVLRQQLRAAGLAQAGKYQWESNAAQTLQVYERVTGAGNGLRLGDPEACRVGG